MNAPVDVTPLRIETPRLILRAFQEKDLADLNEYARVDGVGQMAGWQPHRSIAESRDILEHFISGKKTLALELRDFGKVIGSLGLEERDNPAIDSALSGREFGYVLSRDYWGQGLMPEAVRATMDYCFETLNWDYITCGHYVRNRQSRRVIEKCGFAFLSQFPHKNRLGNSEMIRLYIRYNPARYEVNHV